MVRTAIKCWSAALDRLLALLTGERRERGVLWVLAAYWAVWSAYGIVATSSQDIHFDMGEAVVWALESLAGTPKAMRCISWCWRTVKGRATMAWSLRLW